MFNQIINTHVQDVSKEVEAPCLWDIVRDFHALGESSKAHCIREFIHEHNRIKAEIKNLRAWQQLAEHDDAIIGNKSKTITG